MRRPLKVTSRSISVAVTLGLLAAPAMAQSVQELRAQIDAMSKRLEELEAKQKVLQSKTEGVTPNKPAVTSGKKGVKLSVSGQVNRGLLYVDNGETDDIFHVDNDNSSTRVRFIGSGALDDDISVGTQIEVQFESNSSAAIRIGQDGSAGPNNFTERKLELYADSKRLGRVWVGQGDTASNGTSEVDLSGTTVVSYAGIADMAGGIAFGRSDGTLGPRINQSFSNFDGLSRDDRIRYDTPSLGGFKASASAIEGGSFDVALRYGGNFAGTKVVAAAAYANANSKDNQNFEQYNGSITVLFPMGLSLTGAVGERDPDGGSGDDPFFYYGKLGYTFAGLEFGKTSLAIDYAMTEDLNQDGDEFMTYGAFLVQNFDMVATELYFGARNHELDRRNDDFDDIFALLVGGRVKF